MKKPIHSFLISNISKQHRRRKSFGNKKTIQINVKKPFIHTVKVVFRHGKKVKPFTLQFNGIPSEQETIKIIKELATSSFKPLKATRKCRCTEWVDVIRDGKKVGRGFVNWECTDLA